MAADPAQQLNRSACQADFTYSMTLDLIKICDLNLGNKSVTTISKMFCARSRPGIRADRWRSDHVSGLRWLLGWSAVGRSARRIFRRSPAHPTRTGRSKIQVFRSKANCLMNLTEREQNLLLRALDKVRLPEAEKTAEVLVGSLRKRGIDGYQILGGMKQAQSVPRPAPAPPPPRPALLFCLRKIVASR